MNGKQNQFTATSLSRWKCTYCKAMGINFILFNLKYLKILVQTTL